MKIRELMTPNVVTIETSASCHDAIARMHAAKIRHLPVVADNGRLIGIVTDRDLRHRLFVPGVFREIGSVSVQDLLSRIRVDEIMSTPVTTVGPDDDLEEAARRMLEDKLGSLPVVDDGRVVGIITETDLLRRIVEADSCGQAVEYIVVSYP